MGGSGLSADLPGLTPSPKRVGLFYGIDSSVRVLTLGGVGDVGLFYRACDLDFVLHRDSQHWRCFTGASGKPHSIARAIHRRPHDARDPGVPAGRHAHVPPPMLLFHRAPDSRIGIAHPVYDELLFSP
jgi:hypothetical protein